MEVGEAVTEIEISKILVGKRFRKDLGDIASLAKSIRDRGLLHCPVVLPDNTLVVGQRRVAACKELGWEMMPCRVVEVDDLLRAEHDENELRKEFTVTERVAIGMAIEEQEKPKAKERQREHASTAPGKPKENTSGNLPEVIDDGEEVAEKAAAAVGMSRHTYEKAKTVVEAAATEPETYSGAADEMDRTGKVEPSYKQVKPFADKKLSRFKTRKSRSKNNGQHDGVLKKLQKLWESASEQEQEKFVAWINR